MPGRSALLDRLGCSRRLAPPFTHLRVGARQPEVYLEDLCFQAQQATEKALKALLLRRAGAFPYVHDLRALLDRLEAEGEDLPGRMREVVRLNQYAVAARYPGVDEPVEPDEYEEAVGLAEYAVEWVRAALSEGP